MIRYLVLCVKAYVSALRYSGVKDNDSVTCKIKREYHLKLHQAYCNEIRSITHDKMFGEDSIKSITVG